MTFGLNTNTKLRIARLLSRAVRLARRIMRLSPIVDAKRREICWRLDLREGIDLAIYLFGNFERSTVVAYERIVTPGDTVLDIGANVGAHTLPLAKRIGAHGQVIAFEPTRYAFQKLKENIGLNPMLAPRIRAEQVMLVDSDVKPLAPKLYSSWELTSELSGHHPKHGGVPKDTTGARSETLDHYLERNAFSRVAFLKLDVDGYEYAVLNGARRTLQRYRPILLMEFMPYGLEEQGRTLSELITLLAALEYEICDLRGRRLAMDLSLERRIPTQGGINVLCYPKTEAKNLSKSSVS